MTTTTNLELEHIAESSTRPDIQHNDALDRLDAVLTEMLEPDLSGGSVSITAEQYRACVHIACWDTPGGGATITLPQVRKFVLVTNDVGSSGTASFVRGSTTVVVAPGEGAVLYTDGSTNGLYVVASHGAGGGGGAVAFTDLTDVPSSYTGHGGKTLVVKGDESGLEFSAASGGGGAVALTESSGTIAIDASAGQYFTITLDGDHQFGNPSNLYAGWTGRIQITQDGTGGHVPTWDSAWTWPGGTPPTLSTAPGAVDVVIGMSFDGTTIRAALAAANFS